MTAPTLNYQPRVEAPPAIIPRLSLMMFLQFAIQGAWLPLIFGFLRNYRNIDQVTVGNILAVGAVGAMISPLIIGQIADRYLNAERVMALCHFLGAAVVFRIAYATNPTELGIYSFLYGLLYTPSLGLVNAISFRHLPDSSKNFGKVRVFGTLGWVVIGISVGHWLLFRAGNDVALQFKYMADAMTLSAILGIVLGLYSFTLPATPPSPGREKLAPLEALQEILRQPLLTLFLLSFPVAALHAFFFARAAEYLTTGPVKLPDASWINKVFGVGGGGLMTVGQMSELIVLSLMPLVVKRVNRKVLLSIGLCAYTLRFFVFAYFHSATAVILALGLHGIVFGCFFFLVFITIEENTTKDVRSSAQNVFNLIIFGVGVILGNWFSGWLGHQVSGADDKLNWQMFYAVPGAITLGCLLILLVLYPNRRTENSVGIAPA